VCEMLSVAKQSTDSSGFVGWSFLGEWQSQFILNQLRFPATLCILEVFRHFVPCSAEDYIRNMLLHLPA